LTDAQPVALEYHLFKQCVFQIFPGGFSGVHLFRIVGAGKGLIAEFLPFAASLMIAQMFIEWGSFSPEPAGIVIAW